MKANAVDEAPAARFGMVQAGILLLGLITAAVHLIVLNSQMIGIEGHIDLLFTLNGLGYLALLAAYFMSASVWRGYHGFVRLALIGFTAITIGAWVILGRPYTLIGYFTKTVEILLIILLLADNPRG